MGIIMVTTAENNAPIAVAMASEKHLSLLCLCRPSMIFEGYLDSNPRVLLQLHTQCIYRCRPLCDTAVSQTPGCMVSKLHSNATADQIASEYIHITHCAIDSIQTGSLGRPVHTCVKASHIYVYVCEYRTSGNS